ncbi:J domain-containing protein [Prosthecobacter sp.]|uniref:J domain-containing protein n=1 Tax=Prosthecobacter sp. TaxID=1965333 RepID=UPI0037849F41
MSETITSYPLVWPREYKRCASPQDSKFGKGVHRRPSVADGIARVREQLEAFNSRWTTRVKDLVISTNMPLRLDGWPRSDRNEPLDSGVAVYFTLDKKKTVLCCDKWLRVGENLAAIAATLEAMRGLERWGVSESERAFTGFAALPAPGQVMARTCWEVLGISAVKSKGAVDNAWRARAKVCHPDVPGGSHDAMTELNTARDQALLTATEA